MKKRNQFDKNNVTVQSKTRVFDGFFKVDKYAFYHDLFNGGRSELIEREIFERGHAVAVLPFDPATGNVLLVEQIRIGALATKDNPWMLECIAGMVEAGQSYAEVAKKEAHEEAGLTLDKLEFMLSYLSSSGGTTERLHLYLALSDLSQAGGVYGLDCEGEDIKVHVMPLQEAYARVNSGEIDNAATVISLQWLLLNQQRIESSWQNQ